MRYFSLSTSSQEIVRSLRSRERTLARKGMPVQKLPRGLDGDDGGGKSVPFRVFPDERGKSLPDAQGEFGEKASPFPEGRPQDLGECKDEVPVGDGADHLLPDEFRPQGGARGWPGCLGRLLEWRIVPCLRQRRTSSRKGLRHAIPSLTHPFSYALFFAYLER
jgi:hypothetical protein